MIEVSIPLSWNENYIITIIILDKKVTHHKYRDQIRNWVPFRKLEELLQLAQNRSPVFDIVSHPTPVEVSLKE